MRGPSIVWGLSSWKRVGFSAPVRGEQPPGTERQRRVRFSIRVLKASEREVQHILGSKSTPTMMVWLRKHLLIIMIAISLTQSQRSNDAVRFPGLSSSSMRVASSFSKSSSNNKVCRKRFVVPEFYSWPSRNDAMRS